jgi:hypothetical protein
MIYLVWIRFFIFCFENTWVGARVKKTEAEMEIYTWIMILTAVLLFVALVSLLVAWKKGRRFERDYFTWFWLGLIWMVFGGILALSQDNPSYWAFAVMGLVFLALGLKNRDQWHKRTRFADLSPDEKRLKVIRIGIGLLLVASLYIALLLLD